MTAGLQALSLLSRCPKASTESAEIHCIANGHNLVAMPPWVVRSPCGLAGINVAELMPKGLQHWGSVIPAGTIAAAPCRHH